MLAVVVLLYVKTVWNRRMHILMMKRWTLTHFFTVLFSLYCNVLLHHIMVLVSCYNKIRNFCCSLTENYSSNHNKAFICFKCGTISSCLLLWIFCFINKRKCWWEKIIICEYEMMLLLLLCSIYIYVDVCWMLLFCFHLSFNNKKK